MGTRGRFVRLCVQVDLNKPLVQAIKIGSMSQKIHYEGVDNLCFRCGYVVKHAEDCEEGTVDLENRVSNENTAVSRKGVKINNLNGYGEWMIVKGRKKGTGGANVEGNVNEIMVSSTCFNVEKDKEAVDRHLRERKTGEKASACGEIGTITGEENSYLTITLVGNNKLQRDTQNIGKRGK